MPLFPNQLPDTPPICPRTPSFRCRIPGSDIRRRLRHTVCWTWTNFVWLQRHFKVKRLGTATLAKTALCSFREVSFLWTSVHLWLQARAPTQQQKKKVEKWVVSASVRLSHTQFKSFTEELMTSFFVSTDCSALDWLTGRHTLIHPDSCSSLSVSAGPRGWRSSRAGPQLSAVFRLLSGVRRGAGRGGGGLCSNHTWEREISVTREQGWAGACPGWGTDSGLFASDENICHWSGFSPVTRTRNGP